MSLKLLVTVEHRFDRTPDGAIWTQTMFPYAFWTRYLAVFEHVYVLARVRDVPSVPDTYLRADGPGVSFKAVPYYVGPCQYILRFPSVREAVREAYQRQEAVIFRVPSQIATLMVPLLRRQVYPYAVEVVGDPYDVYAPGAVKHPLRAFFRWWAPQQLRRQCLGACAAAYVTEQALQRRYPPGQNTFATSYSDVELPPPAFVTDARRFTQLNRTIRLIMVGTLAQMYKAPDVLIDAVAICLREGLDLELTIVGDGKLRPELEARARDLELGERVRFLGQLPAGEAVRAQLDKGDVFVLPSRQEGLPRAMIEAMARALPCIGSTVGGIPELLPPEDMVPPGDAAALARKIQEVVTDPRRMARMSARNLAKAAKYHDHVLRERRNAFYRYVKEKTEEWLDYHGSHSAN